MLLRAKTPLLPLQLQWRVSPVCGGSNPIQNEIICGWFYLRFPSDIPALFTFLLLCPHLFLSFSHCYVAFDSLIHCADTIVTLRALSESTGGGKLASVFLRFSARFLAQLPSDEKMPFISCQVMKGKGSKSDEYWREKGRWIRMQNLTQTRVQKEKARFNF